MRVGYARKEVCRLFWGSTSLRKIIKRIKKCNVLYKCYAHKHVCKLFWSSAVLRVGVTHVDMLQMVARGSTSLRDIKKNAMFYTKGCIFSFFL